jgi:hypothetical protein
MGGYAFDSSIGAQANLDFTTALGAASMVPGFSSGVGVGSPMNAEFLDSKP